jgi:hypothetical protein
MGVVARHLDWASVVLGKTPGAPTYSVPDLFRYLNQIPVAGVVLPLLTVRLCVFIIIFFIVFSVTTRFLSSASLHILSISPCFSRNPDG